MYNQSVAVTDENFDYATNPVEALERMTVNQMTRMYPTVNLLPYGLKILDTTLNRTLQYMMHLDQTFSLQSTFDYDHFKKMKAEGEIYGNWLDSPDGTPFPEALKYSPIIVEFDDDGLLIERVVKPTAKNTTSVPSGSKIRKLSVNSSYQRASTIFQECQAGGISSAETKLRFINDLGMKETTASVYYSKLKNN